MCKINSLTALFLILILLSACIGPQISVSMEDLRPNDVRDFADEFFEREMQRLNIPGLVFIFVRGDQIIYAKGYGFANLEDRTSMDPSKTIMAIGSVSKPFVATVVMQLVERGEVDLNTDVNENLRSFQLPDIYGKPVTIAHLLTHTGGFEDPPYAWNADPSNIVPLNEYLATNMPERSHRTEEVSIYSSHGYALAALIVEDVSGIQFNEYVDQNIFKPLAMNHGQYLLSTPLPDGLATGYFFKRGTNFEKGKQIPQPPDYDNTYPSGSIIMPATDMAHFIAAQLSGGCFQGSCILKLRSVALMQQPSIPSSYENQTMTLGFVASKLDGDVLLGQSGSTRGFGNILHFLPEHNIGFFISFNGECYLTSACDIIPKFREEFFNNFR